MASGDPVVQVLREMPPGTVYATLDTRAGGSTPAETVIVHDFDASTIEYMDYLCRLHGYGGGGLTLRLGWSASSAASGVTRWGAAIRRVQDDGEDIDASHAYSFNDTDSTAADISGEVSYDTVTFTDGVDMDLWADGELAIVRLRRNATHANDTMAGDAELWSFVGEET